MGSGKTTISQLLADRTKMSLVDCDEQIEHQTKKSISAIFSEDGEIAFRDIETHMLQLLSNKTNTIIATGGGVIERNENVSLLQKLGLIIHLWVDINTALSRISDSVQRPLVQQGEASLRKLFEKRQQRYIDVSDIIINSSILTPSEIVEEIIEEWEREGRIGKISR